MKKVQETELCFEIRNLVIYNDEIETGGRMMKFDLSQFVTTLHRLFILFLVIRFLLLQFSTRTGY